MEQFRALQTFFAPELKSQYVEGMVYTIRDPALEGIVNQWVIGGRVERVRVGARIVGRGIIAQPKTPKSRWQRFVDFMNGGN